MKIRHSIKRQFAYIFIGLLAGTILLCWFLNNTFLEKYYVQNKQKALMSVYQDVNEAANEGNIDSTEFGIELQEKCSTYNITLILVDTNSKMVRTTTNDSDFLKRQLLSKMESLSRGIDMNNIILQGEDYIIQTNVDTRSSTEYIELWGFLDNGNPFLLQTPVEGIRDSVKIANRFLAYVGSIGLLLGAIVIYFISKKISEPILKLADISKRMTNLDFEAKYEGSSHNEVALLGSHINQLSETLQNTISELKTANNELQKDIEKKNEIDEMRKEFLANVSHELKTPIALIQGYAEGLMEGVGDDEESRSFYCEVIADEADKMNTLVKKLLTLNQLEFGNDINTMERFQIVDMIRNTIQSVKFLTKQGDVEIYMEDYAPVYVWADEFKVEEVLRNYLTNALNHSDGKKPVDVKLTLLEGRVRISVFNSGKPIPEGSIPYLWDKFYKVDKARTREYGGSGVGLSIVKAIMEGLNQSYGLINYQDGVEFWFELATN